MAQKLPFIAVFSLAYAPFEGGAEIAARKIIAYLPGFRFTVFTHRFDADWPEREANENAEVIRLGKVKNTNQKGKNYYENFLAKFFYTFRAWRAAERRHRRKPFQAIWAIMASYGGLTALLFKLRHPSIPFLLTLQEGDSEKHILRRVGIFYPFWRLIFKKADRIQVISTYLGDFARRHGAKCPIEVVPNGVDLEKFQIPKSKYQINSKFRNPNIKTIITTSRLVYKNGVDVLIRAFAKVINDKRFALCNLLIIGDGPLRQELEKLARDLDIVSRVKFFGQVPYEEIPKYLSQADIFVRASRSEGLGSSFLEAMAAGLPIVGTPVGGIPDFLKDAAGSDEDANGLAVRADDADDLKEKILMLLNDKKLCERLGSAGRELIFKRYGWEAVAKRMSEIIASAVNALR